MTKERLDEILSEHAKWLRTRFSGAIQGERADLRSADLRSANLRSADLRSANLRSADLCGANLRSANLCGANLCGAKHNENTAGYALACPEKGSFIGFKKASGHIVEIEVMEDAKRSSAATRKCRCSKAKVISISNIDGSACELSEVASNFNASFIYRVGEIVEVEDFDENRWSECSTGIHFFITRDEAVRYRWMQSKGRPRKQPLPESKMNEKLLQSNYRAEGRKSQWRISKKSVICCYRHYRQPEICMT